MRVPDVSGFFVHPTPLYVTKSVIILSHQKNIDLKTWQLILTSIGDPFTFREAIARHEKYNWKSDMVEEIEYLKKNHTLELVQLHKGKNDNQLLVDVQEKTNNNNKKKGKVQDFSCSKVVFTTEGDRLRRDFFFIRQC